MFILSLLLLGLVANGEDINYPVANGIAQFSYTASDPDGDGKSAEFLGASDTDCATKQTDDNLTPDGGCQVLTDRSEPMKFTWGSTSSTVGMVGQFYAEDITPGSDPVTGADYAFYDITRAAIVFTSDGCFSSSSTATLYYTDASGTSQVNTLTVSQTSVTGTTYTTYTFEVEGLSYSPLRLEAGADIGFNVQSNVYCESQIYATEFILEGDPVATAEPTRTPTNTPSTTPTTATPTMAPTGQCKGELAWGDPHIKIMAGINDQVPQYNYQKLGWFYYIAPCDISQFDLFPFFFLSYHTRCYWRNNPKGCINNNKLILNTKPNPWIIEFNSGGFEITTGSGSFDVSSNGLKANGDINTNKKYKSSNPLVITYNDDLQDLTANPPVAGQSGEMHIYYESNTIVIRLFDVQYDGLPRSCNKNTGRGELLECGPNVCEDLVIDIRNEGSWTYFTCPSCLRNIACGLAGKYYRGDCDKSDLKDPSNGCSGVLVGSNGVTYRDSTYNGAWGDTAYGNMADTWEFDEVNTNLAAEGLSARTFAKEKNTLFKHKKKFPEGRSTDITVEDAEYYDGYCKNNITHINAVKELCRLNTVVKYAACCKEIAICDIFWLGCVEDYCSCTEPDASKPANITDEWCLNEIIMKSMNTTCSVKDLYPTATPTAAPTPSPTGLVAGLPQGQKAEDLIWLYLIFVVLFVVIAGGAYWYYRKKNVGGKATFEDNVDGAIPDNNNNTTEIYTQS